MKYIRIEYEDDLDDIVSTEISIVDNHWINDRHMKKLSHAKKVNIFMCNGDYDDSSAMYYYYNGKNYNWHKGITDKGLMELVNVRNLSVIKCENINGKFLESLPFLKKLNLKTCNDKVITEIKTNGKLSSNFMFLEKINLSNTGADDETLKVFSDVKKVKFKYCDNITDEGLKYLAKAKYIDLSYCDTITDEGISYLKKVRTIKLTGCKGITGNCIKYLEKAKYINLEMCENLTEEWMDYIDTYPHDSMIKH